MRDLAALLNKLLGRNKEADYKAIATGLKKSIDQYEDVLKYLMKDTATPAPVTDHFYRYPTEAIQLPRYAYHINPEWFYYMRMDSVTLRTVVLKIKQEIFRETSKEGFLWEAKFDYKCNICGMEYQEEMQVCTDCQGQSFNKPNRKQKTLLDSFLFEANHAEQTFLEVLNNTEDDLNTYDDLFLVILKDYTLIGSDLIGVPKEIYRGDPKLFRIVADEKGRRGGIWVCPKHRSIGQMQQGYCQQPACNYPLQEAFYAESEGGGPDAAIDLGEKPQYKYYIRGEVIHASKYEPTSLYGTSPIYTLWVICRTLVAMDIYVQKQYEKGRKKGILVFNTDNFEGIKALLNESEERLQNDPHYIPTIGVQHETGRGKAEFIKMMDSLAEMNYIPAKEMLNRQIAAIYGVMPIFQADLSTSGGLNNEGLQITVTDRAVDFGQAIYHNIIFPKLLKAFGITDWDLKLRPSRETDEMAELQRWHQKIESARVGAELGLDIELKEGEFEYSGKVTSPTQQLGASPFLPPGQPPSPQGEEEGPDLGTPCPPGKHRTAENRRCHPIEWDLNKSEEENYLIVKCRETTFQQELKEAQDPNHRLFWTIDKVKLIGDAEKATNLYFETNKGIRGFFKIKGYGQEKYKGKLQSVVYFERSFTPKQSNLTKSGDMLAYYACIFKKLGKKRMAIFPKGTKYRDITSFVSKQTPEFKQAWNKAKGLCRNQNDPDFPQPPLEKEISYDFDQSPTKVFDMYRQNDIHVEDHEDNKTRIDFYNLNKKDLANLVKAQESGRKLSVGRAKIEQQFTKNIAKLYTKLYFARLEKAPKDKALSKEKVLREIDEATADIQEPVEKEGWLEVNRAYFKGKKSVDDIKKENSPDWLDWNKLPYSKSDNAVLQSIYSENPFWESFSNLTQSISNKFKELITESYMAPTEQSFKTELKNVQDAYPDANRERQLRITYGRLGKMSLPRIIAEMKQIVVEDVYRLERIARTETTTITARGREQSFRETDPENQNRYEWFGPLDHRTSDECREIQRRVQTKGGGKGVPLDELKDIMKSVVNEANRPRRTKWTLRDWSPHANCRRVLRRIV